MKICVPVNENKGLESMPYNHFGSAPMFLVYNDETEKVKEINNGDLHHEHGMCQPIKAVGGENVDVVLVGGIGAGAINKLNAQGIKVYKACNGTVEENIKQFKEGNLSELSVQNACQHHDCSH